MDVVDGAARFFENAMNCTGLCYKLMERLPKVRSGQIGMPFGKSG